MNRKSSRKGQCKSAYWVGGAVASWLVRSSPDRAVRVRALAGDIVLRDTLLSQCLSPPRCINGYAMVCRLLYLVELESELSNCFRINLLVVQDLNLNPLQRHFEDANKRPPEDYATLYLQGNR